MANDFTKLENSLDKKLQLKHLPITKKIDGFVTAGSFPAPNVIEAAASMGVNVISLNEDQIKSSKRTGKYRDRRKRSSQEQTCLFLI